MCKLLVLANAQLGHQRTKHDRIVTITTLHTSPIRGTAFLNPAEDLQPGRQLTCVSKLNYKHYPSPKDYIREDILMVLNQVHPSRCATSNPSQQGHLPGAWGCRHRRQQGFAANLPSMRPFQTGWKGEAGPSPIPRARSQKAWSMGSSRLKSGKSTRAPCAMATGGQGRPEVSYVRQTDSYPE